MLTFNAIDVETANADRASICQIGIVSVRNGEISEIWQSLINPEDWFDPFNVHIHGIGQIDVIHSPTLPQVREELRQRLQGSIVVSHTPFDRVALERAMKRYGLEHLQARWLDSARIVRRAWPDQFGHRGWGLKNVASALNISFKHHDALEDARAATEIVLRACAEHSADIEEWLLRVRGPIFPTTSKSSSALSRPAQSVRRKGNSNGELFGETVVFTGALAIPRQDAADLAAKAGCDVVNGVSRKVTLLVIGTHDRRKLNGYRKSSKHRKAEALIAKGQGIKLLSETDFSELMNLTA